MWKRFAHSGNINMIYIVVSTVEKKRQGGGKHEVFSLCNIDARNMAKKSWQEIKTGIQLITILDRFRGMSNYENNNVPCPHKRPFMLLWGVARTALGMALYFNVKMTRRKAAVDFIVIFLGRCLPVAMRRGRCRLIALCSTDERVTPSKCYGISTVPQISYDGNPDGRSVLYCET